MSDIIKARREVFTLLHHGLDLLSFNAPGGIRSHNPLDGGVELSALSASLKPLPRICRLDNPLSVKEIHEISRPAMTQVVSWVAPPLHISVQNVNLEKVYKRAAANDGDKALSLLELALKMIEIDVNLWIDGEYQEGVITPSTLAKIFKKVPREVESFQDGISDVNPLTSLLSLIPSNSNLARIMEASGILGKTTMLELLLDEDLQNAARWLGRKEIFKKGEQAFHLQAIQLLGIYEDIFGESSLIKRPISWFGPQPEKLLVASGAFKKLSTREAETALGLLKEFQGTLEELLECGRELS